MTLLSVLVYNRARACTSSSVSRGQRPGNGEILPEWWWDGWKEPVRSHQRPGDRLSQQRLVKAACAVQARPPHPYLQCFQEGYDPRVTVFLHVSAGAPWSPLELFSVLVERRGRPQAQASSCHSGRTEWRPRKMRPDRADPQPTTSGLH